MTEQAMPQPMTVDEVGERYTNKWVLMEVTECDEYDTPVAGIVLAIGKREADIQDATMKALREPNLQSKGYFTWRAYRRVPPGPEGSAIIQETILRSVRRGIRKR
jgi:hypothetical protein